MVNGITMWIACMLLASWIPAHWKRRIVGYGMLTDITVHITLQLLFGGDSAGRIGMLFGGVLINLTMHAYKHLFGYEQLTKGGWLRFAGRMTKMPPPPVPKQRAPRRKPGEPAPKTARSTHRAKARSYH